MIGLNRCTSQKPTNCGSFAPPACCNQAKSVDANVVEPFQFDSMLKSESQDYDFVMKIDKGDANSLASFQMSNLINWKLGPLGFEVCEPNQI